MSNEKYYQEEKEIELCGFCEYGIYNAPTLRQVNGVFRQVYGAIEGSEESVSSIQEVFPSQERDLILARWKLERKRGSKSKGRHARARAKF